MITDYHWIDDNSELEQLIISLNNFHEIAFDSEFERINTYYPKPALFQFVIEDQYYLIDMKKITETSHLKTILDDIIIHSGSEDLEILYNLNNSLPSKIYDTQIAASLCGFGLHVSYQNLVSELLGINLDKSHSRSDWMQRPLTSNQIQYALEDVIYLNQLKEILTDKLSCSDRISWMEHLISQKANSVISDTHIGKTYSKIAKSGKLGLKSRKLLYTLLNWREKTARQRNKPRGWILNNKQIMDIIKKLPETEKQLIEDIGLYPKFVKYNSSDIFSLYSKSNNVSDEELPDLHKLSSNQMNVFNTSKKELNKTCDKLGIPPALIINMEGLKSLIASGKSLSDLDMWQLINN